MQSEPATHTVRGQPSWHLASTHVEAYLTHLGGQLGPITFDVAGRKISPYALAPWTEEPTDSAMPPMLKVLRGDFFCMPFGGNEDPVAGIQHPAHGETANEPWHFESMQEAEGTTTLHTSLDLALQPGRVDKHISLVEGHRAVYVRHVVSGMRGPMSFGHHAMLAFPNRPESGRLSTSPFIQAQVSPEPVERPEAQGYSLLKTGAVFSSLEAVPTITGEVTDVSRYPARRGYEDLVMLCTDPSLPFAWTAMVFQEEGYVWFALKNPSVLRQTVFWLSNGGRYYAPWNGRHVNVMGLEEVTSYFHFGLASSMADNPLSAQGIPTCFDLSPNIPLDVRYVMAVAAIPDGFDRVQTMLPGNAPQTVVLESESGMTLTAAVDVSFVAF